MSMAQTPSPVNVPAASEGHTATYVTMIISVLREVARVETVWIIT